MTTIDNSAGGGAAGPGLPTADQSGETGIARLALAFTNWAERWYPDAYVFVSLAVAVVAAAALANGASPAAVANSFGEGFWSLITFTMQMTMIVISGYVVATSPAIAAFIEGLAALPRTGRAAVGFVAAVSVLVSLLHWALALIFSGLLVRAMARRSDLKMDYRAAAAAGYLGNGTVWALGLSSSAAQLQANPASLPKPLLEITGVIAFTQTIFLWQSMAVAVILLFVCVPVVLLAAPSEAKAVTAKMLGGNVEITRPQLASRERPGEWLEYSPLLTPVPGISQCGHFAARVVDPSGGGLLASGDSGARRGGRFGGGFRCCGAQAAEKKRRVVPLDGRTVEGRVGEEVAILTPHRPVRAAFPHTVLHGRDSFFSWHSGGRAWPGAAGGGRGTR